MKICADPSDPGYAFSGTGASADKSSAINKYMEGTTNRVNNVPIEMPVAITRPIL
jgi:hypothetical protein